MNWDQVWIDVNVATMDTASSVPYGAIENAAIAVKDGKVAWIGPRADLPEFDALATPIYRGKGKWITPGLIDAHTHLVFAGSRANEFELRLQGASYEDIARAGGGIISTVKACREADEATLFDLGRKRLNALAKEGVTTVEIKSGYGLDTETELKLLRVAKELGQHHHIDVKTTFLGAHAIPAEYKNQPDAYVDLVINEMLPQVIEHQLADAVDVFCEGIAFNLQQTERVLIAAQNAGLSIKLHAEQLSNIGGSELAARLNALSVDHIEHLDEAGDFNPGSSPICSTKLMLNMACTFFRLTPEEALKGLTINAAKALGIDKNVGSLVAGKQADFCLWDINSPAELAYTFGVNPCEQVIKTGKIIQQ